LVPPLYVAHGVLDHIFFAVVSAACAHADRVVKLVGCAQSAAGILAKVRRLLDAHFSTAGVSTQVPGTANSIGGIEPMVIARQG